jgi:hypothetical protein
MSRKSALPALALSGFLALGLGGCVIVDADDHVRADWTGGGNYGELMGAEIANNQITVRVTSNGCTTKDFIGADVDKTGDNRFAVGFYRAREDYCKAYLPEGVELSWTFAELGIPNGAAVRIRNDVRN